jgi:type III pantothenate kinase
VSAVSTLLVDIGNTRVKWAPLAGRRVGRQRAAAHAGWTARDFVRQLYARRPPPQRVVVVSVARAAIERAFVAATRAACGFAPEFVRSERSRCGVTNGYRDVWRLGADRWVALIGARTLARPARAACVVDAGTAITLDLLDERGHHRGGAIVPGPDLMVNCLLSDTSGIRRRAGVPAARATGADDLRGARHRALRGRSASLFAQATRAGVEAGALHAAAAVIERAGRLGASVVGGGGVLPLVLTGGAAGSLRPLLAARGVRHVPDLVLRGLAAIAVDGAPAARARRSRRA